MSGSGAKIPRPVIKTFTTGIRATLLDTQELHALYIAPLEPFYGPSPSPVPLDLDLGAKFVEPFKMPSLDTRSVLSGTAQKTLVRGLTRSGKRAVLEVTVIARPTLCSNSVSQCRQSLVSFQGLQGPSLANAPAQAKTCVGWQRPSATSLRLSLYCFSGTLVEPTLLKADVP